MTYATLDQLKDRYSEAMLVNLTDRAVVATGTIDGGVVNRALADTDEVINGFLAARYQLPLVAVPGLVADIAMQIAIWKLHLTEPDAKIAKDYDGALKMLRDIGTGVIKLQAAGVEAETSGAEGVVASDRERPFTEASMKGFI